MTGGSTPLVLSGFHTPSPASLVCSYGGVIAGGGNAGAAVEGAPDVAGAADADATAGDAEGPESDDGPCVAPVAAVEVPRAPSTWEPGTGRCDESEHAASATAEVTASGRPSLRRPSLRRPSLRSGARRSIGRSFVLVTTQTPLHPNLCQRSGGSRASLRAPELCLVRSGAMALEVGIVGLPN